MYVLIACILKLSTFTIWVKWTVNILVGLVTVPSLNQCELEENQDIFRSLKFKSGGP